MKPIDIIYAKDLFSGIGIFENDKYDLPWSISVDMKYFNNVTSMTSQGLPNNNLMNAVIMGKNTWLSIGSKFKPLPNRVNIIISTSLEEKVIENLKDTYICRNLLHAYKLANTINKIETIFVIGGGMIYDEAFKLKNFRFLYETIIHDNFNCNIKINGYGNKYTFYNKTFLLKNLKNDQRVLVDFTKSINLSYANMVDEKLNDIIPKCINYEEQNYLNILEELIREGEFRKTRNSNTWSLFNKSINFDLSNGFPLLTSKRVNFKAVFEELLWFLKGDTNAKHLDEKGIKIWNDNSSREFLDKNGLNHYDVFDIGPMYGFNLVHYGCQYKGMNEDYSGKGFNQLDYILDLIKNDPNSRRIVMSTFNPSQAKEGVLYPCHGLVTQFYVSKGKLDIVTYQRSVDIVCGFPFNIASYALLCYLICEVVNNDPNYNKQKLVPGKMTIHLGDYHLYEEHYDQAILQILRSPFRFPTLVIKNKKNKLTDFEFEDLELLEHKTYRGILAKMVA